MTTQANRTPADAALQAATRTPNYARLKQLGARLSSEFQNYERDRRLAEMKWTQNARQFLGIYDPDVLATLEADQSRAYPKLTRVKCVSMLSRLMNLLFPSSERNWSIDASPVPNLAQDDLNMLLETLQLSQDPNTPLEDKIIEMAIVEFAKERSRNLEREIDDQLKELGGTRQVDYVSLCRKVLMSGIVYGMGVLKGPFVKHVSMRTWERDAMGKIIPKTYTALRPQYEFVPIWDYYPDLSAKYFHQMDGQFQMVVMSRHQIRELADREDFFGDVIKNYLKEHPKGNYRRRTFESEIKAMGVQSNVNDQDGRKYEVLVWDGYISGHDMQAAGFDVTEDQLHEQVEAIVWVLDGEVIKADMNPWVQLDVDTKVNTYHHFVFEEDESGLVGNGLPNIVRDSQMGVSAAARMLLDNASITCGPNVEVNMQLLHPQQDITKLHAYKRWYRDDTDPNTAGVPAVRDISFNSHMSELMKVIEVFGTFADTETFINPATGGDMSNGPSEPFRTATGASLLKGDAALPFKDVVRNFDLFTQSVLSSLVAFNMQFNPKRTIKGDHQVIPRGATSLIAKEVRGMILDNLAQTLTGDDARYINRYDLLRERLAARDVDTLSGILCSKDEAKQRDQSASEEAQRKQQQIDELLRAEVRKILAEGVKNLTQADKNAANADQVAVKAMAETMNLAMGELAQGVESDGQGNGKPAAARGMRANPAANEGRNDGPSAVQVATRPVGDLAGGA
jgi:hypothetical protein